MDHLTARSQSLSPDPEVAAPRSAFVTRFLALILVLGPVLLASTACGDSPDRLAVTAYKASVVVLLDEEMERWKRFETLHAERRDHPVPFHEWIDAEGVPFYADLRKRVEAVQPEAALLQDLHAQLTEFIDLRHEYFRLESANRELYAEMRNSIALNELEQFSQAADDALDQYYKFSEDPAFPDRTKDPRFRELHEAQQLWTGILAGLQNGRLEFEAAKQQFRSGALEKTRDLSKTKFMDDEGSRLLAAAVTLNLRLYEKYDEVMPLHYRVQRSVGPAAKAVQRSEQARKRFIQQMKTLDRTTK